MPRYRLPEGSVLYVPRGAGEPGMPEHPLEPGGPEQLPESGGGWKPGQNIPPRPWFPSSPDVSPPVDPEWDGPAQGPVVPSRPGEPPQRPEIPVVYALDLEPWMRPPADPPSDPGCYVIVYYDDETPKALAWMNKRFSLPRPRQPQGPSAPSLGGHWVPVETDPQHNPEPSGPGEAEHYAIGDPARRAERQAGRQERRRQRGLDWAFVFEIGANWGKRREDHPQAPAPGPAPGGPAPAPEGVRR